MPTNSQLQNPANIQITQTKIPNNFYPLPKQTVLANIPKAKQTGSKNYPGNRPLTAAVPKRKISDGRKISSTKAYPTAEISAKLPYQRPAAKKQVRVSTSLDNEGNIQSLKTETSHIPVIKRTPVDVKQRVNLPAYGKVSGYPALSLSKPAPMTGKAKKPSKLAALKKDLNIPDLDAARTSVFSDLDKMFVPQQSSIAFGDNEQDVQELKKKVLKKLAASLGKKYYSDVHELLPRMSYKNFVHESAFPAEVHLRKGKNFYVAQDYMRAFDEFDKALKKQEHCADAYYGKSLIFKRNNYFDLAAYYCNRAIKSDSQNPEYFTNLGSIYSKTGNHIDAVSAFTRAIILDPSAAKNYYLRGKEYSKMHEYDMASENYLAAKNHGYPLSEIFKATAELFAKQKKYDSAVFQCNEALKCSPDDGSIYMLRGKCREKAGDYASATSDYMQASKCKLDVNQLHECTLHMGRLSTLDAQRRVFQNASGKSNPEPGNFCFAGSGMH